MQQPMNPPTYRQTTLGAGAPAGAGDDSASDSIRLMMRVLDEVDYGLMVLDEAARMRFANQVALRECARGAVVRVQQGVVGMQHADDQRGFLKALRVVRGGVRTLLPLNSASGAGAVAVVPLNDATATTTLLIFGKRQLCEPLSMDLFAHQHGLSHAEGSVLRGLCSGLVPDQIARQSKVAISTVRTQISSIRSKTGTHGMVELIGRLTALPPIIAALHQPGWIAVHPMESVAA